MKTDKGLRIKIQTREINPTIHTHTHKKRTTLENERKNVNRKK